jgi:hypothetical protein
VTGGGAAIVFTKTTTPQDDSTGAPGVPGGDVGRRLRVGTTGDPKVYRDLNLTEAEAPTRVLRAVDASATLPPLGCTGVVGRRGARGQEREAALADGTAIAAWVVIAR